MEQGHTSRTEDLLKRVQKHGLKPNIVMSCDSADTVKNAVKNGMGLGILYRDFIESDISQGSLKIIRVPGLNFYINSFIVYRKEKRFSANAQDFLLVLREYAQKTPRAKGLLPTLN